MIKIKNPFIKELFVFFFFFCLFIFLEALISNGLFFYSSIGWIDHWLYLGHFENTPLFKETHVVNYKSSRLPWVWQGYLIFKFFGYPWGNYVIAISSLLKFWLCFWLVSREYVKEKSYALLYVVIFIFHVYLKSENGGWYYHNFEACTWWLLSLFVVRRVEQKKLSLSWLLLAGFFAGISLNISLFFINFLPVFFIISPNLLLKRSRAFLNFLYGGVSTLFIIGTINSLLGGSFHYYIPGILHVIRFNGAPVLWKPLLEGKNFYLLMTLSLISFINLSLILKSWIAKRKLLYFPLTFAFIYTALIYLFWHFRGIEIISCFVHSSVLLLMGLLMIVETTAQWEEKISSGVLSVIFAVVWLYTHSPFTEQLTQFIFLAAFLFSFFLKKPSRLFFPWVILLILFFQEYASFFKFSFPKDETNKSKLYSDIVFEIKNELQKISSPTIVSPLDHLHIGEAITSIGMYAQWPTPKDFPKNCVFLEKKSSEFLYYAKITETGSLIKEELRCQTWNKYDELILERHYRIGPQKELTFTIHKSR